MFVIQFPGGLYLGQISNEWVIVTENEAFKFRTKMAAQLVNSSHKGNIISLKRE